MPSSSPSSAKQNPDEGHLPTSEIKEDKHSESRYQVKTTNTLVVETLEGLILPIENLKAMERHKQVASSIVTFLGLVAFICCVVAEFKRAKEKDVKMDNRLCSIPQSSAYGLGITALVCLSIAHILGTSLAGSGSCSSKKIINQNKAIVAITLPVLSWLSFGMSLVLLSTAASMNKRQSYGRGWLDGRCYVVKPGIFAAAGVLVFTTVAFTHGFNFTVKKMSSHNLLDEGTKQVIEDDIFKRNYTRAV